MRRTRSLVHSNEFNCEHPFIVAVVSDRNNVLFFGRITMLPSVSDVLHDEF